MSIDYYALIQKGLSEKYFKQAGPVQEIEITFTNKDDIIFKTSTVQGGLVEVDFVAKLKEIKTIYSDLTNPSQIISILQNVAGTLFVNNNQYDDLILEFNYEAI